MCSNGYRSININKTSESVNGHSFNWGKIYEFTDALSKRIYSKRQIDELCEIYKDAEGITAGNGLPDIWTSRIEDIKNFDKDSFIINFGKIFSDERNFADIDILKENLTQLFQKHKIVDDKTPLDIQLIGYGFQAWVYKISIGDNPKKGIAVKLFKLHKNNNHIQNHGNKLEQNSAEYVRVYSNNDSSFAKYYFGDIKNGIMVMDYVSQDSEPPKSKFDMSDVGICYIDNCRNNYVNGYICDYGGIGVDSNLIGNKPAQEVYRLIKYAATDEEKLKIFNKFYNQRNNTDEFKDKAIGLVHAIKFLPEEIWVELYEKCHDLKSHRVNIALIQNIKNFSMSEGTAKLINDLVLNSNDQIEMENIAKEIKYIPLKIRCLFLDNQIDTKVSDIIKYLSKYIINYRDNAIKMKNAYEHFIANCDTYSGLVIIDSMKYMDSADYDEYYEKFFSKNNSEINNALARSLSIFNDNPATQRKWINKLLECKDKDVDTGLAEAITFVNEENRTILFENLLTSKNKVTKEFLARNVSRIPEYTLHTEYIEQLLDGADNIVRESLLNGLKPMLKSEQKQVWINMVLNSADSRIKEMATFTNL